MPKKTTERASLDGWLRDLRFAGRMFHRYPGTTWIAVVMLALGIGVSATLASVVRTVLLEPLPYPAVDRLVFVWESFPSGGYDQIPVAGADFVDFEERVGSLNPLAAFRFVGHTLTGVKSPVELEGLAVTAGFFPLLGIEPALGRTFVPSDEKGTSGAVAMLGYRFWREAFGGDPAVIGRVIHLSGEPYEVVGVATPDFRGPPPFTLGGQTYSPDGATDVLVPLQRSNFASDRVHRNHFVFGRLAPGAGIERAERELATVLASISAAHPEEAPPGLTAYATAVQSQASERSRPALLLFLGAGVLILVIVCTNVASLLLTRAVAREREWAVRSALGAGRGRLIRQLLIESMSLTLLGAALGTAMTAGCLKGLPHLDLRWIPRLAEARLDWLTLGAILLLALTLGVVLGLVPTLHASRPNLIPRLQADDARGMSGPTRLRLQEGFVVLQLALALSLLAAAGLAIKSYWQLQEVDAGFEPRGQTTVSITLPEHRYPEPWSWRIASQEVLRRVRALPGVESVGATSSLPLVGLLDATRFFLDGRTPSANEQLEAAKTLEVTPGFARAMGIEILHGRFVKASDREESRPIVVVNETLAHRTGIRPARDVVGRILRLGSRNSGRSATIVGVAEDVRLTSLDSEPEPTLYLPFEQAPARHLVLVLRSPEPPAKLHPVLRETLREMDADLVLEMSSLDEVMRRSVAEPRVHSLFLASVAGTALALGAIGIAGVMGYAVRRRRQEMGIRLALGARYDQVIHLLLRRGATMALMGIALGLAGAWSLGRAMSHLLFGVSPHDPAVLILVSSILFVVALLATYLPARGVLRHDPSTALDDR